MGLIAEAELLSKLGPVGGLTGVCRSCGIENTKPLDHPLRTDPHVLGEEPLQVPQTHPRVIRQLLGSDDFATPFGLRHQSRNFAADRIRLRVGQEQVGLEGFDHLGTISDRKDPSSSRPIVIAKNIVTRLNGPRDPCDALLQQRVKPAGVKGGTESVAVAGKGSEELFASDTVNEQSSVLGGDVHPWLGNDLLPVGLLYGPPHKPVVIDELGQGGCGGNTFNVECLPASLRANDRVRTPRGLRHASQFMSSHLFKTGGIWRPIVRVMTYSHEATCRFNVASWTENLVTDIDGEGTQAGDAYYPNRGVTQTEVGYTYKGDIEGTSKAVGLIAYKDDAAPIFSLERFEGSIGGHEGTCVFRHVGDQDKGSVSSHVEVVPGMGTGGLENLRGEAHLTIAGHSDDGYELVLSYDVG